MKKATLILLSFIITLTAGWWRTYGEEYNDYALCVTQTDDSAYIVVGHTYSFRGDKTDIWILKITNDGDTAWSKVYGGENSKAAYFIEPTSDGNFIITGSYTLLKINREGDSLWSRTYDGFRGSCIRQTADGGFIITGYDGLLKTDSTGDSLWVGRGSLLSAGSGSSTFVEQTADSGYIIAGSIAVELGSGPNDQAFIIKSNEEGLEQWNYIMGKDQYRADHDCACCVRVCSDDGYIVAGRYSEEGGSSWLSKIDGDDFSKTYENHSVLYSVLQTPEDDFIAVGDCMSSDMGYMLKIDNHGNSIWERTFGSTGEDVLLKYVIRTLEGGYLAVGWADLGQGMNYDMYILKTDSLGLLGVEEPESPPETQPGFEVITAVGREIVLMFNESSPSLTLRVFDPSGRQVDELHVLQTDGTVSWGMGQSAGVYFIVPQGGNLTAQKVILVK